MKKLMCFMLALLLPLTASAQTLTLPENLIDVAQEAFRGDTSITEAVIPSGAITIGAGAFADCSALKKVTIPASVLSIGQAAFEGCASSLLISTEAGSAAMEYAASNQIDYQAGTTYRALLVGQCAYESPLTALEGPANDIAALSQALSLHPTTPYQCTVMQDLTKVELKSAIATTFADAKAQDVSLFYYSGHGASEGKLVSVNRYGITPAELKSYLDAIPGRKIVIVDACFSGAIIGKSAETSLHESFNEAFLSAFSAVSRSALAADSYYVITAARGTQDSYEFELSSGMVFGLFTRHLCSAIGYDYLTQQQTELKGDSNGDGVVSIYEAHQYAAQAAYAQYPYQEAQVHPENCTYQSLTRK